MFGQGNVIFGERVVAKAALAERVRRAATALKSLGVHDGGVFALFLRNDFAYIEARYAAELLGAVVVPINWHLKADEAGYILKDSEAEALVVHADLLPQIADGIPAGFPFAVAATPPEILDAYRLDAKAGPVPDGAADWNALVDGAAPLPETEERRGRVMMYTSGTTGHPKGVLREPMTPDHLAWMDKMTAVVFAPRPGMVALLCGPAYHAALEAQLSTAMRIDGDLVIQPRFEAEGLLKLIERRRITHGHMVPIMFHRLLSLPEAVRKRYDTSSLECILHGAAPCPNEVKRAMIEWWGPVLNEYYGSTELGVPIASTSADWLARPGTAGKLTPGAALKIYDDDGNELPPGKVGEIFARSPSMADFTYKGRDDERRAAERDGLVSMGDVGYLDEDGYLFVTDRKRDMVNSGGVNIYPAEIEATLLTMAGVKDCAVFGIPDAEFGEAIAAVIEPQPGAALDEAAVRDFLSEHLAGYKVPRLIRFETDLPREETGKIFKRRLRAPFWEQAGRSI